MTSERRNTERFSRRGRVADEDAGEQTQREGAWKRQLVLVAEDERHEWEMYGKVLWYNGFDVLHAADGEEALALARRTRPDLILLDIMLPKVDGIEICRRVKGERGTQDIPILALSALSKVQYGGIARRAGCVDYLEKPIGPLAVLHAVEELIGRPPPPGDQPSAESPWS